MKFNYKKMYMAGVNKLKKVEKYVNKKINDPHNKKKINQIYDYTVKKFNKTEKYLKNQIKGGRKKTIRHKKYNTKKTIRRR
jgi:hypothetical protein